MIQTVKSEVVSHLSYIVGSKDEAAVMDPRRDCQVYLDIVTGSLELANLTGATIFQGPGLPWKFGETLQDNQEIKVGSLKIRALHTPGHSPESTSYVLHDLEKFYEKHFKKKVARVMS